MKAYTGSFWLTVIVGYYMAILLKALVWVHNHGGYAAHDIRTLVSVTFRSSTVDAGILLGIIFAVSKLMALTIEDRVGVETANVAATFPVQADP